MFLPLELFLGGNNMMVVAVGLNGACLIWGVFFVQTFLNVILAFSKNTKFSIFNIRGFFYLNIFSHFGNKNKYFICIKLN